jgi:hypothetical protein
MVPGLFDGVPLWVVLVASVSAFLVLAEVGFRVGSRRRAGSGQGTITDLGTTLGGLLGLLGLLLAFTFGMAGERYDRRKTLVVEEANAIGTAWLRADLVPEPMRGQAREILREYTQVRLDAANYGNRPRVVAALARSEQLHEALWAVTVAAAAAAPSPATALFVASVNEVIDMHGRRIAAAVRNPIPPVIFGTLYLVALLVLGMLGYSRGVAGDRNPVTTTILAVVLAVVMALILDLDRPGEGYLRVSQQAMVDVRKSMGP